MNLSTAVMLINPKIKAVRTSYNVNAEGKGVEHKIYKTLDTTLEVGDLVVVPTDTRHGYTIVRVEELDVEIDFESSVKIDWLAGKFDKETYHSILVEENKWISAIKASEERKKREDIKKNLLDAHADVNFDTLSIAHMGSDAPHVDDVIDDVFKEE